MADPTPEEIAAMREKVAAHDAKIEKQAETYAANQMKDVRAFINSPELAVVTEQAEALKIKVAGYDTLASLLGNIAKVMALLPSECDRAGQKARQAKLSELQAETPAE